MRHGRRASLLLAACLLTSAATARAECAWLLWSSWQGAQYVITSTHEDRVGCVRAIDLNLIRWGSLKYADGSTPGTDLTALTDGKGRFWTAGRDGQGHWPRRIRLPPRHGEPAWAEGEVNGQREAAPRR